MADARPAACRRDVPGARCSAFLPAVVEKRGCEIASQLLAALGAQPGADDDLGTRGIHLIDLIQNGGDVPDLAPALLRSDRLLAGAAADIAVGQP